MLATIIHGEKDIRLEEVPNPVLSSGGDAIIRVVAACVCGSDLWPYRGITPTDSPKRIGHEFVGIVESIGPDVSTIKPGDFVIAPFYDCDMTCANCLNGVSTSCLHGGWWGSDDRLGGFADGAQGERVRVPHADGSLVATPGQPDAELVPSLLTLADVMGKGTGAAILASALRMAFKLNPGLGVAETIRLVSDEAANDLEAAGAFATLVHARYQPLTGRVDYADAGHGLTIVVRTDGTVERLQSTGLPIGIAPHLGWDSASVVLAEGDVLLSVSDGVLDLFDGTIDSLNALALFVTPHSSAHDIADRVKVAAKAGPDGGDDVTVIVLRRLR